MDLEQANRVLELKPGASFRQVSEAREDLLALWNPNRISDHPRLRAKAARKVEEIHQAYSVLMEHLGQDAVRGSAPADPIPGPIPPAGPGEPAPAAPASGARRPSLYDELFSGKEREDVRRIPVGPIAVGALLLVLALAFFVWWSSEVVVVDSGSAATRQLPSEPPVALPAGGPAEKEEIATPPALTAPAEVGEPEPPAVEAVAATPSRTQPPPTPAVSSPPRAPRRAAPPPKAESPGETSPRPALRRESANTRPAVTGSDSEGSGSEEEEKQRAEEFERVFRDLLANSAQARKLVDGQFADLRFAQWNVVNQTDTEIWLELVAQKPDGNSVHFTWAINPADGTTRALSAAARTLEGSGQVR